MSTWKQKISGLRDLTQEVGRIWPESTKLSGYAERGPYHCGHCKWLTGESRCTQPVVKADPQVKKDKQGFPVVDAARGCCEFVDPS
jgi:hypothetical protein